MQQVDEAVRGTAGTTTQLFAVLNSDNKKALRYPTCNFHICHVCQFVGHSLSGVAVVLSFQQVFLLPPQKGRFLCKSKIQCKMFSLYSCYLCYLRWKQRAHNLSAVLLLGVWGRSWGVKNLLLLCLKNKLWTKSSLPIWTVTFNTNEEVQGTKFSKKRSKQWLLISSVDGSLCFPLLMCSTRTSSSPSFLTGTENPHDCYTLALPSLPRKNIPATMVRRKKISIL